MRRNSGVMVDRWRSEREDPGSNPALPTGIFLSKKFIPHLLFSWKLRITCKIQLNHIFDVKNFNNLKLNSLHTTKLFCRILKLA